MDSVTRKWRWLHSSVHSAPDYTFHIGIYLKLYIELLITCGSSSMEDVNDNRFSNGPPGIWPTFTVSSGSDSSKLRISIIHPVSHLDVSTLSPQAISTKKTVFLDTNDVSLLADLPLFQAKVLDEKDKLISYAYLSQCPGISNAYCLVDCGKDSVSETNSGNVTDTNYGENLAHEPLRPVMASTIQDTIEVWKYDPQQDIAKKERLGGFSMKPPAPELPPVPQKLSPFTISPKSESNPLKFLLSRYYSTLYSLTTPLSYFPKTALARFKIMCGSDKEVMKTHLLSVYLTTEQLEERYNTKFGLEDPKGAPQTSSSKYEVESRQLFASKYLSPERDEEKLRKFVLELKIREAHLQILVLMELLLAWPINEEQFLLEMPLRQARSASVSLKRSLVRRKGTKKKIIPTFIGVGVQELSTSPERPIKRAIDELSLYTSLMALVDQMGIWDSLLGRIKGVKDESMFGFLAYVLVPFFNKQLPRVVQFVVQRVKELRPKLTVPKSKTSKKLKLADDLTIEVAAAPENDSQPTKKPSRFAKVVLSPDKKPFLQHAAATGNELQPAFLLKRSKSNLGSKNLKRRQVDMSVTSNQEAEEPSQSRSFLFGDARRFKSISSSTALPNVSQVGATPMKRSKSAALPSMSTSMAKNTSQVLATPSNVRVVDIHQQILETPHNSSNKFTMPTRGVSVLEKLARLAPPMDDIKIVSSPVKGSPEATPNLFLRSSDAIASSPQVEVTSSPVITMTQKKLKPGEPVAMNESPFFRSNLRGLPPPKSKKGRLFKSTKLVRKETQKTSNSFYRPDVGTNDIPSLTHNYTTVQESLVRTEAGTSLFAVPLPSFLAQREQRTTLLTLSKSGSASFEGSDTDSDSDLEKLLSSAPKPAIRKYSRK